MQELAKIDQIRHRLGVSYREAREALEATGWDVVEALVYLEEKEHSWQGRLEERGEKVWAGMREALEKGARSRVKVVKGADTVLNLPLGLGAIGLAGVLTSAPLALLAGVGAVAALMNNYRVELDPPWQGEERDS